MLKRLLVPLLTPPALAVRRYPVVALSMDRPANVATPATAATVVVPLSVARALPVPPVMATVTLPTKAVTLLLNVKKLLNCFIVELLKSN